jgi:thioredoxin reductase (NADPH)
MQESAFYDVVILGTGPAGLQAAIHAARRKVSVLILGKQEKSSLYHAHVENFCCIFNLTGEEILRTGMEQAIGFGAEFTEEDVMQLTREGQIFGVKTESGRRLQCKTLIIATGSTRKKLRVAGEKEYLGKGVSYCVECDANFFRNEDVAVIGNESAAAGGALTLLDYAGSVHLVAEQLDVVDALRKEIEKSDVILHQSSNVKEISGGDAVDSLVMTDGTRIPVSGVFIELGAKGLLELALNLGVQLDEDARFIQTNKQQETNIAGVYAAGDICGPPWQMAKAVGEGCVAGLAAATYARKLKSV